MLKRFLRSVIDSALFPLECRLNDVIQDKASAANKIGQRHLYNYYRALVSAGASPALREAGFRVFSQFEEDGKLLFIFAALGVPVGIFLDIGAADGINSNCANLALNHGWMGLFIDGSAPAIARGEAFYKKHPDTWAYPPKFVQALVGRENINDILTRAALPQEIDMMSIDIDGNDYWVWDAIDRVTPKVVMIETNITFGKRNIVVPYDKDYFYPGKHPLYHGASPTAMMRLANKKGYRLVGCNNYGFNTIYVRRGLAEEALPEVSVETVLAHPRNSEWGILFDPIKDWNYVEG